MMTLTADKISEEGVSTIIPNIRLGKLLGIRRIFYHPRGSAFYRVFLRSGLAV